MSMTAQLNQPTSVQFAEKAAAVKDNLKEMGHLAPDAAKEKYDQFKQGAASCYEKGKNYVSDMKDGTEEFIRERPFQSVLIAAGAGMLVGFLIARSRR